MQEINDQNPKNKDYKHEPIANDCYKYIMDLTTNGVVITDAIKFVQTNKEKLTTTTMSTQKNNGEESKEPDYDEDNDQLEEKREEETQRTGNHKSSFLNHH